MRGISCVQIPTTLLSQIDSSVGGKTAVDLGGVKNVVGAFYQPCEVLVEPAFLATLPEREIKCGVGEMVKYAALNGEIFDRLHSNIDKLTNLPFLTSLIVDCIRHKAAVVQADEKERGERKSLNVGHTTGHAIELTYGFSHGESVLLGMLYETKAAIRRGVCEREYGNQLLEIVQAALRISPCPEKDYTEYDVPACAQKAKSDKKNTDDGEIKMSVAKSKGAWTTLSLPFANYQAALIKAAKN
jgi:3-dehydroquinate synthetase